MFFAGCGTWLAAGGAAALTSCCCGVRRRSLSFHAANSLLPPLAPCPAHSACSFENLHSILHHGLLNASGTRLERTGGAGRVEEHCGGALVDPAGWVYVPDRVLSSWGVLLA